MISSETLKKCISIIDELYGMAENRMNRRLILELGYIIRQELTIVETIENQATKLTKNGEFTIESLLKDNTQLFKENESLIKNNLELKNIIDQEIPNINKKIKSIEEKINEVILSTEQ